jgi:hypothetical protein
LPEILPEIVENPEEIVSGLSLAGEWDLVLFLGESPSAFALLPEIMKQVSAKAVIAPADDYSWLPKGLERQIRSDVEAQGKAIVFPRTFCTLTRSSSPPIDEFARCFGSPELKMEIEDGLVKTIEVLRGSPCGSTVHAARKLIGIRVEEAPHRAAILVQTYPCLASRRIDRLFNDAPIHVAGRVMESAVLRASKGSSEGYRCA